MSARDLWNHLPDSLKHVLDALSIMTLLGNLISILPAASTVLTFIWASLRVYESPTVQGLLKARKKDETQ